MSPLAPLFRTADSFAPSEPYRLLPFTFARLDPNRRILTNVAGQHLVVSEDIFERFMAKGLRPEERWYQDLEAGHFLANADEDAHVELLAAQVRTRQSRLPDFTALHIFVLTLRCDHSCAYCQVSRVSEDRHSFDMSRETADKAIDLMFQSPSPQIKVEFQGGESLLNFPLLQHVVERVSAKAQNRHVAFVVATNLSPLTDEMLDFFRRYNVAVSTSLDGPRELHNDNRPRPGRDSYERTIDGIVRCREKLGTAAVSALMTCTASSLDQPEAIIDEYVRQGFSEIFLRHISPYGFAVRSASRIGYETEKFLAFYRRGIAHILKLNQGGVQIRETYATLLLQRMLTSYPTGYVDLQSPAGAALGALVYNYDGEVYASDEGRMLAEMGDRTFCLGNVHRHSWEQLFTEGAILDILYRSMSEGTPQCHECAFQPWCGSDPVFHHATQGDFVGHKPTSAFCRRNMEIFRHLVALLEDDPPAARVLRSWLR
ncbi:MAG TPA: His-Xaa-Ser system radical SAM maturase HxsB [Opitutaceae bacterium]|nr:His-Xaa-Ser system radical SAM maturase HxsB [Opitutaceae bacterium]